MTQSKQSKSWSSVGHWVRVAVMFLSGGFIFPHAMTEDEDIAKYDADMTCPPKTGPGDELE